MRRPEKIVDLLRLLAFQIGYDNAIRKSLIQNFNEMKLRQDAGQLWENFMMVERRKANQAAQRPVNTYFWRTYDQKEIDCIEERGGKLYGHEFKWGSKTMPRKTSSDFLSVYPGSELFTVSPKNFESFLLPGGETA